MFEPFGDRSQHAKEREKWRAEGKRLQQLGLRNTFQFQSELH